jgi:tetratricopeptide (TPR) repeat protein
MFTYLCMFFLGLLLLHCDSIPSCGSAEDFLSVEVLYERGVGEYLSASLWVEYLEFVEENDLSVAQCTPPGITKMRALCERALAAAGLHFTEGGKVWEAYREFEQALLISMVEASQEAKSKQVEIVRSLFRRQLTVPLANHNLLLEEYKDWEQQQGVQVGDDSDDLIGLPNGVALAYKKAVQMCRAREPYEAQIACETLVQGDLLQHYLGYIALEEATGEPARAQILYERAVSEFPVTQDIWLKYTEYLDVNLKVASVIRKVYARAVRNCPWVATLWTKYMLALERGSAPETELAAVFEQALLSGFQTPNEYEEVFLTRAHGLRRRIMAAGSDADNKLDFAVLHETFDVSISSTLANIVSCFFM